MTRQPVTLDTLALAISCLRQKGPHLETANDLAIDVLPVVRAMGEALHGCIEHMEYSTPQGREAFVAAVSMRAAFGLGHLPVPDKEAQA